MKFDAGTSEQLRADARKHRIAEKLRADCTTQTGHSPGSAERGRRRDSSSSVRFDRHSLARVRVFGWIGIAVLALALTACGAPGDPSPTTCDGISSEIGGCDEDRPAYAGETCEEVGREYGQQLSQRSLELFNGPDDPDESRAVRAWQLNILTAQLANKHLRDLGIVDECEADVFLAAAENEFSPEFKDQAGTYLFDGPPVSYAEWRAEIRDLISGFIDEEEDVPYDGADDG